MEKLNYTLKDSRSDLKDWELVVVVLIVTVCILLVTIAMIFAIKNQLCGYCVRWADATSEITKACSVFLKKRYRHLDVEEAANRNSPRSDKQCSHKSEMKVILPVLVIEEVV